MFDSGHLHFKRSGSWKCERSEMVHWDSFYILILPLSEGHRHSISVTFGNLPLILVNQARKGADELRFYGKFPSEALLCLCPERLSRQYSHLMLLCRIVQMEDANLLGTEEHRADYHTHDGN